MSSIGDNGGIRNDKKIALRPGQGKSYWLLGDLYTFKLTGDDTGGAFALVENTVQPQNGPPPHIHHREDETFYVLEGEFSFFHGDTTFSANPGSFIYIPKGTLHTYKNVSGAIGRLVFLLTPSGFEKFFEEIGEPAKDKTTPPPFDPATVEKLMKLAPKYHLEVKLSSSGD
jgi:quercetin dioxygenase-like cupin family protein